LGSTKSNHKETGPDHFFLQDKCGNQVPFLASLCYLYNRSKKMLKFQMYLWNRHRVTFTTGLTIVYEALSASVTNK